MPVPADNLRAGRSTVTVAICGNPNCGKSTIFNAITGLRQHVGNYPGVTVEKTSGRFMVHGHDGTLFHLLDIPGTYSLAAYSPDEYIAASALFGRIDGEPRPDVAVCVVDASNLERALYFVQQVTRTGASVILALNMMDLLEASGRTIDTAQLNRELGGIPVIPMTASRGVGVELLKKAIAETALSGPKPNNGITYDNRVEVEIDALRLLAVDKKVSDAELVRVLLDIGGPAEKNFLQVGGDQAHAQLQESRAKLRNRFDTFSTIESTILSRRSAEIVSRVIGDRGTATKRSLTDRVDSIVLHPVIGLVILGALLLFIFQSIFTWAEPAMHVIDDIFSGLSMRIGPLIGEGPFRSLITDGVIGGVGSVLAFLPQIVILFVFVAILEDSGYMPRAAFLVDRAFGWCGLSGKSLIPMLSSFACAVPGIMATRTIEDRRQRILTILLAPLMSCSARLPVYTIMIAAFIPNTKVWGVLGLQGLVLSGLYLLGMVTAVVIALLVKLFIFKGRRGSFLMEMPSYKQPTPRSVAIRVFTRAKSFVLRAGTVILAITIVIWALSYYPRDESIALEYSARRAELNAAATADQSDVSEANKQLDEAEAGAYLRDSYFGRLGRLIEPVFRPLGWDWKITMAALASFPAREVVIATLGTIYNLGSDSESGRLADKFRGAKWESGDRIGQPVFNPAVAMSIMVFFALCCQCGATLVTIKQEVGGWRYPAAVFIYMTALAYFGALAVYQVASRMS